MLACRLAFVFILWWNSFTTDIPKSSHFLFCVRETTRTHNSVTQTTTSCFYVETETSQWNGAEGNILMAGIVTYLPLRHTKSSPFNKLTWKCHGLSKSNCWRHHDTKWLRGISSKQECFLMTIIIINIFWRRREFYGFFVLFFLLLLNPSVKKPYQKNEKMCENVPFRKKRMMRKQATTFFNAGRFL